MTELTITVNGEAWQLAGPATLLASAAWRTGPGVRPAHRVARVGQAVRRDGDRAAHASRRHFELDLTHGFERRADEERRLAEQRRAH